MNIQTGVTLLQQYISDTATNPEVGPRGAFAVREHVPKQSGAVLLGQSEDPLDGIARYSCYRFLPGEVDDIAGLMGVDKVYLRVFAGFEVEKRNGTNVGVFVQGGLDFVSVLGEYMEHEILSGSREIVEGISTSSSTNDTYVHSGMLIHEGGMFQVVDAHRRHENPEVVLDIVQSWASSVPNLPGPLGA